MDLRGAKALCAWLGSDGADGAASSAATLTYLDVSRLAPGCIDEELECSVDGVEALVIDNEWAKPMCKAIRSRLPNLQHIRFSGNTACAEWCEMQERWMDPRPSSSDEDSSDDEEEYVRRLAKASVKQRKKEEKSRRKEERQRAWCASLTGVALSEGQTPGTLEEGDRVQYR
jgi:hypothetical protein